MFKRFFSYYKPYKGLFILDISAAVIGSLLSILFPLLTRELLRTYIPNQNWSAMIFSFALMLGIYFIQTFCTYIQVRWGHQLGV